eukprot:Lithocolla_globosa_v1_NODE_1925_length_2257_cov_42.587193.p1 type:complete len:278 gc:universal NODE_1925_length_2257_cov_42.587193:1326-2159(+)
MKHLLQHNILSCYQYAFRPQSDTTAALTAIIDDIMHCKNNKHPIISIFIDLTKAYDTILHQKLLSMLKHRYNFHPTTLALFTSYFTGRMQTTHTPYAHSAPQLITHGTPQGSILSTTLFIMYIKDIHTTTSHGRSYIYADDITYIASASTALTLQTNIHNDLNNIINYLTDANLVPSISKTSFTQYYPALFHATSKPHFNNIANQLYITINNNYLEYEDLVKLLGIQLYKTLRHHDHILALKRKLLPNILTLRYASRTLPLPSLRQLYFPLVYSHLI